MTNMNFVIRNITSNECADFLSILHEAATWLKNEGKEMWVDSQLTAVNLLNNNKIEEMFVGYSNNEPAVAIILKQEDSLFWPDNSKRDSL